MKSSKFIILILLILWIVGCSFSNTKELFSFSIDNLDVSVVKRGKFFYSKQYIMNSLMSVQKIHWWFNRDITAVNLANVIKDQDGEIQVVYNLYNIVQDEMIVSTSYTIYLDKQGKVIRVDDPYDPRKW